MRKAMTDRGHEFDCIECGRHVVRMVCMPNIELCGMCISTPGWHENAEIRAVVDPDYHRLRCGDPQP